MTEGTDATAEAARLAGFKRRMLADLLQMKGLELIIQDGEPLVRRRGEAEARPLVAFIEAELPDCLPALQAGATNEHVLEAHLNAKADRAAATVDPLNPST